RRYAERRRASRRVAARVAFQYPHAHGSFATAATWRTGGRGQRGEACKQAGYCCRCTAGATLGIIEQGRQGLDTAADQRLNGKQKAPQETGALTLYALSRNLPVTQLPLGSFLALDHSPAICLGVDRDGARLLGLWDLAHQVDVQETVLEACALHLNVIGKLEHPLEGPRRDALIEHVTALLFFVRVPFAADRERVLFRHDRELRLIKAGNGYRHAISVLAGPLDIVGRITGRCAIEALIEHRKQTVEADG